MLQITKSRKRASTTLAAFRFLNLMDKKVIKILEDEYNWDLSDIEVNFARIVSDTIEATKKSLDQTERIEERKAKFIETLKPAYEITNKGIIDDFIGYWTEEARNGKKMRFELEKCWNLNRRLATWMKNNNKFNNGGKQTNTSAALSF